MKDPAETERRRRYRERKHARGLCIECGAELEPERQDRCMCAKCAEKQAERVNARRARLREKGLCIDCGTRPVVPGKQCCRQCAWKRAEWQYINYHKDD